MKDLGWRRWVVIMSAVVGVLTLAAINRPLGVEGMGALVGMVGAYCGFDASIKHKAIAKADNGGGGMHTQPHITEG